MNNKIMHYPHYAVFANLMPLASSYRSKHSPRRS